MAAAGAEKDAALASARTRKVAREGYCASLCRLGKPVPMMCLILVGLISASTVNCGWVYNLGLRRHGLVEFVFFAIEVLLLLVSYMSAVFRGPGFVPEGWAPSDEQLAELLGPADLAPLSAKLLPKDLLQFCDSCQCYKPPRAHHCSDCGRCVLWMDHHCPWTGTCVGHHNMRSFVLFVHYVPIACLHSFAIHLELPLRLFGYWYRNQGRLFWYHFATFHTLITFAFGLVALLVACLVGSLAWDMHWTLSHNQTMVEELVVHRAQSRRHECREARFRFPYDYGKRSNRAAYLGDRWRTLLLPLRTPCEDYWPPLREGAGHFDLSAEQLAQKAEKLGRTAVLRASGAFDGGAGRRGCWYWLGILRRHGCEAVCCWPRACNQRRLTVQGGDWLAVTQHDGAWMQAIKLEGGPKGCPSEPPGWVLRDCVCTSDGSQRYKVQFQDVLQGVWESTASGDLADVGKALRRRITVSGPIVRVVASRVPFVLRACAPEPGEGDAKGSPGGPGDAAATTLLGVRLLGCDGHTARWANGEVWTRSSVKDAGEKAKAGEAAVEDGSASSPSCPGSSSEDAAPEAVGAVCAPVDAARRGTDAGTSGAALTTARQRRFAAPKDGEARASNRRG